VTSILEKKKATNGCGDTQVRNEIAATKIPQFVVAMHAFVQLAEYINRKVNNNISLPKAKWERKNENKRPSTNNILNLFIGYYWYGHLGYSFCHFIVNQRQIRNSLNPIIKATNPVFYQRK